MPYHHTARGGKVMTRSRQDRSPPACPSGRITVFFRDATRHSVDLEYGVDLRNLWRKLNSGEYFISDEHENDPRIYQHGFSKYLRPLPPLPTERKRIPWTFSSAKPTMDRKGSSDEKPSIVTKASSGYAQTTPDTSSEPDPVEVVAPPVDFNNPDGENESTATRAHNETEITDPVTTNIGPGCSKSKKKKKKPKKPANDPETTPSELLALKRAISPNQANTEPEVETQVETPTEQNTDNEASSKPKILKILLRGIPAETDTEEISDHLAKINIMATRVQQLKKRSAEGLRPLPLFLILLPDSPTSLEIYQVTHFKDHALRVERFRGGRFKIQCYRCQNYGHTQRNCSQPPRCMKCAGGHYSYEFQKPKDTPPTCCNCKSNHTSNFYGCASRPRKESTHRPRRAKSSQSTSKDRFLSLIKELKSLMQDPELRELFKTIMTD